MKVIHGTPGSFHTYSGDLKIAINEKQAGDSIHYLLPEYIYP